VGEVTERRIESWLSPQASPASSTSPALAPRAWSPRPQGPPPPRPAIP
jgi:hypothetical protein